MRLRRVNRETLSVTDQRNGTKVDCPLVLLQTQNITQRFCWLENLRLSERQIEQNITADTVDPVRGVTEALSDLRAVTYFQMYFCGFFVFCHNRFLQD